MAAQVPTTVLDGEPSEDVVGADSPSDQATAVQNGSDNTSKTREAGKGTGLISLGTRQQVGRLIDGLTCSKDTGGPRVVVYGSMLHAYCAVQDIPVGPKHTLYLLLYSLISNRYP